MRVAVYPGSFDPVTNGHIDILEKTCQIFDQVIVGVIHNVNKQALFSLEERVSLIQSSTKHIENIQVDSFSGLVADFLHKKQAYVIIRGLRTVSDFEYEMQIAMMNKLLIRQADTIFVVSDVKYSFVSSSGVKEAALLGGDVGQLVPAQVKINLRNKMSELLAKGV